MKIIAAFPGLCSSLASLLGICLLLFCLSACQDSSPLLPSHEWVGNYELADLTLVNAESGSPQQLKNLPHLGKELRLDADGKFQMSAPHQPSLLGHWQQTGAYLHLQEETGTEFYLRLLSAKDGSLELEQTFEGRGQFSDGIIFYDLHSR